MTARACGARQPSVLREPALEFSLCGWPVREGARLDVGDAGLGQQREGDDGDLPQVDLREAADAGAARRGGP